MAFASSTRGWLRICLDGRMLVDGGTGVATYSRNLLAALRLIDAERFVLRETSARLGKVGRLAGALGVRTPHLHLLPDPEPGFASLKGAGVFRMAQEHFTLRKSSLSLRTDERPGVMHWTYPVPARLAGWQNIYTIHDTIPFDDPDLGSVRPQRLRAILDDILPRASRIVTVSEHARERIIKVLGCPPGLVVNCYQSVLPQVVDAANLPAGLVPNRYFLYCGSREKRKNIDRLIAGHALSGTGAPLVLAGPSGRHDIQFGPGVIALSYVSDPTMASLIAHARALLFPSLTEGFGLPVVEAMAFGVPALTSNRDALAEVADGAAVLVDPESVEDIADCIASLDRDDVLRSRLRAAGFARAKRFTSQKFALRLERVYALATKQLHEDG
jgi:glycosyltransferase involved in cell wall biosynthesis